MSHLSLALEDALTSTGWRQRDLAAKAGVAEPQISRAVRGLHAVRLDSLQAIAHVLPEPHASRVTAAWLRDRIAPDSVLSALVEIHPVNSTVSEAPPLHTLPPELDDESRTLILWLARQAVEHTAVRDALRSLRAAAEAVIE